MARIYCILIKSTHYFSTFGMGNVHKICFFYIARETYTHIGGLPIDAPKVWKGAIEFLSQRAAVAVFGDMTTEVLNIMSLHPAAQEVAGKSTIVCIDDLKPDKRGKMAESYALAPRQKRPTNTQKRPTNTQKRPTNTQKRPNNTQQSPT